MYISYNLDCSLTNKSLYVTAIDECSEASDQDVTDDQQVVQEESLEKVDDAKKEDRVTIPITVNIGMYQKKVTDTLMDLATVRLKYFNVNTEESGSIEKTSNIS